jgi:putative transposase
MNAARCTAEDSIQFLIGGNGRASCVEAARSQPIPGGPAHDAFTRVLIRQSPDPATVWDEAQHLVERRRGVLVVDDSTLDKPFGRKIAYVQRHWSGKHKRIVWGINLVTLLWTDGNAIVPVDVRVTHPATDGQTKNAHARAMFTTANERGFTPAYVLFDAWYSSLDNLKAVRGLGWHWVCRIRRNRRVNPDDQTPTTVEQLEAVPTDGMVVQLQGYGLARVFRTEAPDGHAEYWATNDLALDAVGLAAVEELAWGIEEYHRGLKQCCNVERCQVRRAAGQLAHLLCAVRAFLRLECHRLRTGVPWTEAKQAIQREATRAYLANPHYQFTPPTRATA